MTMRAVILGLVSALVAMVVLGVFGGNRSRPWELLAPRSTSPEAMTFAPPERIEMFEARFALCDGPIRVNCVLDGDTLWFKGDKIRIADIDAPEIFSPHCRDERQIGEASRDRLLELLNAGRFTLVSGGRETDRYGRKLRTVTRRGQSLGERLVEEGLARRWTGPEHDWCSL